MDGAFLGELRFQIVGSLIAMPCGKIVTVSPGLSYAALKAVGTMGFVAAIASVTPPANTRCAAAASRSGLARGEMRPR